MLSLLLGRVGGLISAVGSMLSCQLLGPEFVSPKRELHYQMPLFVVRDRYLEVKDVKN